MKKERPFYSYQQIFPLSAIEFEGSSFPCPQNNDEYLSILYGPNFKQPPPAAQQSSPEFKYTQNSTKKNTVTKILALHLQRDYLAFNARGKSKLVRPFNKLGSFISFSLRSIGKGVPSFIFRQAQYSFYKILKKFTS